MDLRFVSDSNRGRGRELAHDNRPWASREEGVVAYPLLAPSASYLPRDASACLSPSSLSPTSPSELATSPVPSLAPPPASSLAQPSRSPAFVYFLPAFRGRKPRPRRNPVAASREQQPCGPILPALQRPDRACHEL